MEKHLNILGVLFIVRGVLLLLIGLSVTIGLAGGSLLAGDNHLLAILILVALVIGWLSAVKGIPEILAGWALLQRKRWSRIFGIIMAALEIIDIPFGTALGIYALWVLFNSESERLLRA